MAETGLVTGRSLTKTRRVGGRQAARKQEAERAAASGDKATAGRLYSEIAQENLRREAAGESAINSVEQNIRAQNKEDRERRAREAGNALGRGQNVEAINQFRGADGNLPRDETPQQPQGAVGDPGTSTPPVPPTGMGFGDLGTSTPPVAEGAEVPGGAATETPETPPTQPEKTDDAVGDGSPPAVPRPLGTGGDSPAAGASVDPADTVSSGLVRTPDTYSDATTEVAAQQRAQTIEDARAGRASGAPALAARNEAARVLNETLRNKEIPDFNRDERLRDVFGPGSPLSDETKRYRDQYLKRFQEVHGTEQFVDEQGNVQTRSTGAYLDALRDRVEANRLSRQEENMASPNRLSGTATISRPSPESGPDALALTEIARKQDLRLGKEAAGMPVSDTVLTVKQLVARQAAIDAALALTESGRLEQAEKEEEVSRQAQLRNLTYLEERQKLGDTLAGLPTEERLSEMRAELEEEPKKKEPVSDGGLVRDRVSLTPKKEKEFKEWWEKDPEVIAWKKSMGNADKSPDDPKERYDYRKAWLAGDRPMINPEDNKYHWGSTGKDKDHPTYQKQFSEGVPSGATSIPDLGEPNLELSPVILEQGDGVVSPVRSLTREANTSEGVPSGSISIPDLGEPNIELSPVILEQGKVEYQSLPASDKVERITNSYYTPPTAPESEALRSVALNADRALPPEIKDKLPSEPLDTIDFNPGDGVKFVEGEGLSHPFAVTAAKLLGEKEGTKGKPNKKLGSVFNRLASQGVTGPQSDCPWCAAFVTDTLKKSGAKIPTIIAARQYLQVGSKVSEGQEKEGDIGVMWNDNPDTGGRHGYGGHTIIILSQDETSITGIGGNQEDKVSIMTYPRTRFLGIRRLKK